MWRRVWWHMRGRFALRTARRLEARALVLMRRGRKLRHRAEKFFARGRGE